MYQYTHWLTRWVVFIWICNCLIGSVIAIREIWIPFMNAGGDTYTSIQSDPFDGTIMPIAYIPDWTKVANQDKTKRFEDIPISDYVPMPQYDALSLLDIKNPSKASTILHYTYFTPYMGSYRLNYKENDGSHNAVDIRAPLGTPILSIANGVIVRTIESDATGNKFIVIRHDNVSQNGKLITLYSCYLHLSEILVKEWTKIQKWDMIGRVGMTGIATTPHLHIQIDTGDAPFHPYWPFSTSDSQSAGLGFYDSINTWLGREKALKYSIHPMNFINTYLGGPLGETFSSAPTRVSAPTNNWVKSSQEDGTKINIASYVSTSAETCVDKRYSDVGNSSTLGKMLYPLVDRKCLFQDYSGNFASKSIVTRREAIISLMKYYGVSPSNGTSHFLDIQIGDSFQGYALVGYRRWILDGNYANPERLLSKWEFIDLLVKVAQADKNPSQIRIYSDVDPMNPFYSSAQDYAYMTRSRGGKLNTSNLLTRGALVQILAGLKEKK